MIVLTAYVQIRPDATDTFLGVARKDKAHAATEKGCVRFDFFECVDTPGTFVFVEEWKSQADLQAHMDHPIVKEFFEVLPTCVAAEPVIRIFEASELA